MLELLKKEVIRKVHHSIRIQTRNTYLQSLCDLIVITDGELNKYVRVFPFQNGDIEECLVATVKPDCFVVVVFCSVDLKDARFCFVFVFHYM